MKKSDHRILVTHVGSLPRSQHLTELLLARENGIPFDAAEFDRITTAAVHDVVARQIAAGVDVISNGEQPRASFKTYVVGRMKGFGGESDRPLSADREEFPDYEELHKTRAPNRAKAHNAPQAVAEITYEDLTEAKREVEQFKTALAQRDGAYTEAFITAPSPGIVACTMLNAWYDSHEAYVNALADQLRKEYRLIHDAGFLVQIDAPDMAAERSMLWKRKPLSAYLDALDIHVAALNRALAGIPRDRIRLHSCWGNWDGPHNHDVPMADVLPKMYQANVGAHCIEFSNPRHAHEYPALKRSRFPEDRILVPGVIDSTTNFIEHPELVANRICEAVDAVGDKTRVMAGTDCGFGTYAGNQKVATSVVYAKLKTAREGADIAGRRLGFSI